jgi:hypothetical protein
MSTRPASTPMDAATAVPGARGRVILGLLLLSWLIPGPANGDLLHVPGDHPTIQGAIDAAQSGDTVLVAAGDWVERLDLGAKALRLASSAGPVATRILGGGQPGTLVRMSAPPTGQAQLEGFTLAGGMAEGPAALGGALRIEGGMPLIKGNRFLLNEAVFGGAVGLLQSEARLVGNHFEGNRALMGGALHAEGGAPWITRNAFVANLALDPGYGGALALEHAQARLERNDFIDNAARLGGALSLRFGGPQGEAELLNNSFSRNAAEHGGALYLLQASPWIEGCIFAGSTAGEGLYNNGGLPHLRCTTVHGNAGGDTWEGLDEGGNLAVDPRYCNPGTDLRLQADSPLWDLPCGPGGAHEDDCSGTQAGAERPGRPDLSLTLQPNPANPASTARLSLPGATRIRLQLFDLRGALRAESAPRWLSAGEHHLPLAAVGIDLAALPGGLYFLQLQAGTEHAVARLLLLP